MTIQFPVLIKEIFKLETEIEKEFKKDFDNIPNGDYSLEIVKAETTQSNAGNDMLAVEYIMLEQPFINRRVWQYYTYGSEKIGKKELKRIAELLDAVDLMGKYGSSTSFPPEELVGKRLVGGLRSSDKFIIIEKHKKYNKNSATPLPVNPSNNIQLENKEQEDFDDVPW